MTSHFYLQRTETRTKRHEGSGMNYAAEKGFSPSSLEESEVLSQLKTVEVESAYTSQAFITDIVIKQKKKSEKRKQDSKKPTTKK